jgi:hypothetical protein
MTAEFAEHDFKANDDTVKLWGSTGHADALLNEFFGYWETENDPRRGAAVLCHKYLRSLAQIAIIGAQQAGAEPRRDLWLYVCGKAFDQATNDMATPVEAAGADSSRAQTEE